MRVLMMVSVLLLVAACGADKEKMSRHNNNDNLLAPQQKQIDKAAQVEGLLQDAANNRYQDQ